MMNRRTFLCELTLGALSAPLAAQAQPTGKVWRIGLFHVGLDHVPPSLGPLRETLKTLGYEEGKTILLDWRNLPDEDAARETAREFVRDRVDLIVAFENQTVRAAKAATSEIPIVFLHVDDPVMDGFVRSLSHPGGNLTGFVTYPDSPSKRIQLFKELVPRLQRLLVLIDPDDPATRRMSPDVRRAGGAFKLQLIDREARDQADLERVFGSFKRREIDGVLALSPNLQTKFTSLLIRLAAERRVALAVHRKEWVEQGALFSYAPDLPSVGVFAARYIDRILKGTSPETLPVEEASQFKLVINLKTAKALGLTVPQSVLIRADQVIE